MKAFITALTITLTACVLTGFAAESHVPLNGDGNNDATSKPVKTILTAERLREEFLDWKFGMFIHYNVATYNERQWASGCEDPVTFAPDKLNCDQWVDAAAAAGMKYAVLTVKHTGGWCLWDSKHTTHDITAFKNYKKGKGDIVREFVDACRKRRIKVGFYYCFPGNFSRNTLPEGAEDLHGLPPEAKGDYAGFIKKQLSELLTGYGPIDLLWADQYSNSYTHDSWLEIKRHIKSLQPNCIVIANNSLNFRDTDIHSYEYPWLKNARPARALPPEDNEHPAEVCDKIGPGWFWSTAENDANVKTAEEVVDMLKLCNNRRANYLLNVVPDRSGLIPAYSVERLRQVGKLLAAKNQARCATEYHVSTTGLDGNPGTQAKPFKTISAAAAIAQPGDVITVHEGIYRERINPPRGGTSDEKRIVYRSAEDEKVVIKGSELIKGWERIQNDTWKVVIPNSFFGDFNPYSDLISGDWFNPMGRKHHTGAVYLNDHWLTEAKTLDDVLKPIGKAAVSYSGGSQQYLINLAGLKAGEDSERINAAAFAEQEGVQVWTDEKEGECLGWIEDGDWVKYDSVDFGNGTKQIEFRAASATRGGIIEIRLDKSDGELLGACSISNTGGWYSWSSFKAEVKPASGIKTICLVFKSGRSETSNLMLWCGKVDSKNTSIWAQFKDINPNEAQVEINVRQAVFYPEQTGINYITVRGFTMMHAATPWSPPTAEQIGLVGTHWSKGWIIENNNISYSVCTGITLGKHGDEFDNTSQNSAEGYVETINRALERGWSKENIGGHIVRNNHISHCEQAGLVGSMGAVFSAITGNEIHDIHVRRLFSGAEMAGIKIHGAIDTQIGNNHIFRTSRGIWLDWMTQGTRVVRNLLHDNGPSEDLFVEVNHGPFMIEHNIFLSNTSLFDMSEGGAYVHNLFNGIINAHPELNRETPYHPAHTTKVAGLSKTEGGDNRFFNNIFVGANGLTTYDNATLPMRLSGNVFLNGALPCKDEQSPLVLDKFDPETKLIEKSDGWWLEISIDPAWKSRQKRGVVTTESLGRAKVPDLPYEHPDGTAYRLDTDYFGDKRNTANPVPGAFQFQIGKRIRLKVWPK